MANFYLACFIIGFAVTIISFLMGFAGHGFGDHGDFGHGDAGGHGGHGGDAGHGGDGGQGPKSALQRSHGTSWLSFGTVTAFLTWFGGVGFLLTTYSHFVLLLIGAIAAAAGMTGAGLIFLFMAKVLAPDQVPLDPADYYMPGTLGHVTVRIPARGTGEIVYVQGGSRKTAAARGADGQEVARGTEIVILQYERGVAFVRPWERMAEDAPGGQP
jgi:hypothetical protein